VRANSAIKGLEGGGMEAEPKRRKTNMFFDTKKLFWFLEKNQKNGPGRMAQMPRAGTTQS